MEASGVQIADLRQSAERSLRLPCRERSISLARWSRDGQRSDPTVQQLLVWREALFAVQVGPLALSLSGR
jgi:hypothetical protein